MLEMITPALIWLLTLELFALAALPLSYRVFSRMPDRGFAFAKPLGLLGVSYVVWLVGLSQTLPNSRWTVLIGLLAVAALSWLAARRQLPEMRRFARASWPTLAVAEGLFIAVFAGIVLLRASVPDISHTEQPMDLMFLNATVASPHYPPTDPWLAGISVSYYYLGYLMVGAVSMATSVATPVAYNLGLATAGALAAAAAFGVVYNLVGLARGSSDARILAGLTGAFLLLAASNLVGALELVRAAGAGSAGFWEYIGVEGLTASGASSTWRPDDPAWWWWRASRVIPGAITEFPAFSFVLGDLHPHVMSIAFLLLAAGLATQVSLQQGLLERDALRRHWPLALVAVVAIGSLSAINLWDLPVGLTLVGGAILLNAARNERRMQLGRSVAVSHGVMVVGAASGSDAGWERKRARLYTMHDGVWRLAQFLDAAGAAPDGDFGASVAASEGIVVVGSPRASRTGVAYLYEPWGDEWAHRATLRPPDAGVRGCGRSVAVAPGLAAMAAHEFVFVYRSEPDGWQLDAELPLESGVYPSDATLSLDGETLAVGQPSPEGGVVYVHQRAGGAWRRAALSAEATGLERLRWFGASVSLKGSRLAIGAEGAVAMFRRGAQGWEFDAVVEPPHPDASFGAAVAVDGPYLVVGATPSHGQSPSGGAGVAYVFERTSEQWELHSELRPADAGPDNLLGSAVAIDGDTVALGAPGGGEGGVFVFRRTLDRWALSGKATGSGRLLHTAEALALFGVGSVAVAAPFLLNFESAVNGVLPLRVIMTRPAHLVLIWGFLGFLAAPVLFVLLRHIFRPGNWSLMRFGIAAFAASAPVMFWLQPVYGPLLYSLVVFLFLVHQAGFRLPRADEALFAYNPRFTLIVGSIVVAGGLVWDGVVNSERSADGEVLAMDRLLVVLPMAVVIALAIYAAWTLAHRDGVTIRQVGADHPGVGSWSGHTPALLALAVAGALIMGVELFHVSDIFGGELRRSNTVFKLYYQAWALMAVVAGFGLWRVGAHWGRRRLVGRISFVVWAAVIVLGFGAVSYYTFAAVASRTADAGALTLDGVAYLERFAPADAELLRWVRAETPRDAVVLESALVPCGSNPNGCDDWDAALARVASATGRPTIVGWAGHERQWREDDAEIFRRQDDVRTIYQTSDPGQARALLQRYGVDYVVVGPRERAVYGEDGLAKFDSLGDVVFESSAGGGPIRVHRVAGGGV